MKREDNNAVVDKKLEELAVTILDLIAEGKDEQSACEAVNIRRSTLVKWMVKYPEFEDAVNNAKRMRADTYRTTIAKSLFDEDGDLVQLDKEDVPGQKLNFDKLKWLAEIDNPEKYGTRVKHEGNLTMPVQIVVDTGINNTPIETTAEPIDDVEDLL